MADVAQPRDERDLCEAVAAAAASGEALDIVGGGTKRGVGFPGRGVKQLSMKALSRVIDYDPAELVLTVEPGARLADIEALLAQHNQMLAFEPWDFADVYGPERDGVRDGVGDAVRGEVRASTVGGVVGAGMAGSRRLSAGGVRDHVLGVKVVNGRGERVKAGGRVVKNVTGYDVPRLMAGAWGQLGAMVQVTLKVMPQPREVRTVALHGLDAHTALRAMAQAMHAPAEVAAAAWTPSPDGSLTALRLEGFGPSVAARLKLLSGLLGEFGNLEDMSDASGFWRSVRSAARLRNDGRPLLWRLVGPPSRGAGLVAGVEALGGTALMDWAGGLIWARLPAEVSATEVRKLAAAAGGHAMLADAPEDMRRAAPALHPEEPGVAALSRRVRQAFDPSGVFDPRRFEAAP